jgi:hypothetical protein
MSNGYGYPTSPKASGWKGGCILAGVLAASVLIALLALYHFGILGDTEVILSEDGVRVEHSTESERQGDVIDAVRAFAAAQTQFKARYGSYAVQPMSLMGVGDVDGDMGTASSPIMAYQGYYFIFPMKYGAGNVNFSKDFVLVAQPAEYGATGRLTYAVGPKGIVLKKDLGGVEVTNVSQIDATWKQVR